MGLLRRTKRSCGKIREPWHESVQWTKQSYAQEGEDLVLDRFMDDVATGFYVEVGSHHPFRFSNTYLFYRRGWQGICIDPLPNSKALFNKWRPRDLALELGVSTISSNMKYYLFNEPALNTFDPLLAKERDGLRNFRMIGTKNVSTLPLSSILDTYLPANQIIDFLSVDVEGLDLQVLQSNDWSKYRPKFVVAECLKTDLLSMNVDPIVHYLASLGYKALAKTGNSVIFAG
ncbi:MAG: FkbM family methyltransferase [Methylosarcina sp.]